MKSILLLLCLSPILLSSQSNVGIGTANPHPSAILELQSTSQGVLIPRLDSTMRRAINNPAVGLMVFDLDYQCFYYYKSNSWVSLCTSMVAANTGATGPIGLRGLDGNTGAPGPTGLRGADGNTGVTGPTGLRGADGNTGVTGPTGLRGADGNTGATGPTGLRGLDGNTGATGPIGLRGLDGNTGATGSTGLRGLDGNTGVTGPTGLRGLDGNTGATGPTGILSGIAGGDLSGSYPNPKVVGLQGRPIAATPPIIGQLLRWDGTQWLPTSPPDTTQYWNIKGNYKTNDTVNYIGTNDSASLNFKVANISSGRIDIHSTNTSFGIKTLTKNLQVDSVGELTAFGFNTLKNNTYGVGNTAVGSRCLNDNTTGAANTANGVALILNTSGSANTAMGANSLTINTTGNSNTAIGSGALDLNTTGTANTSLGAGTLNYNDLGNQNTAVGFDALGLSLADNNTAVGFYAIRDLQNGSNNTALGGMTLFTTNNDSYNTANGYAALYSDSGGSYNTGLGYMADVIVGNINYATALGSNAIANASNKIRIGNTTTTVVEGQVPYSVVSDGRFKTNVKEEVKGLDFITRLRPVVYNFDTKRFEKFLIKNMNDSARAMHLAGREFKASTATRQSGFIAQEVERAMKETGYDFNGLHHPVDSHDNYSLAYSQFVVPLVKAVQEQQVIIEQMKKEISILNKRLK